MFSRTWVRKIAAILVTAMLVNLVAFAAQPVPLTRAEEPEPSGSEVEEVQGADCPTCGPEGQIGVQDEEDDKFIYLPLILRSPGDTEPPPGEEVTSGALDLKRVSDWGIQVQVAATEAATTVAIAEGVTWEEKLAYMIAHANQVPDVPQVFNAPEVALASAPTPPISAQGWEGLNFSYDPQERSSGTYKSAGKWIVPPGNWMTWWHSGSFHPEGLYSHILTSAPGNVKAFVGVVCNSGPYFGSNWQYSEYGGWSFLASHVGWFESCGTVGVTISNTGSAGNLTIQEAPYGVTATEIPAVGEPWEPEFQGYESGVRECIFPEDETIHWHCGPAQEFLRLGDGEKLVGAQVWAMTEDEFNNLLPTPGVTVIPLAEIDTAQGPVIIVLVVVGGLAAVAYLGLVAYQATARYESGATRELYFPLEDSDLLRDLPATFPTGVRTKEGVELPGIVVLADQDFVTLRANAANAYHQWYFDRELVWDAPGTMPSWLPYEPPAGAPWVQANLQTQVIDAGLPDPRDFCRDRFDFNKFWNHVHVHTTEVEGRPFMMIELRDVGTKYTSRISIGVRENGEIWRLVETRGPYTRAGRATFLMMISYPLFAQYLKSIGKESLLAKPHVFGDLKGYKYSCLDVYLEVLEQAGWIIIEEGVKVYFSAMAI